MRPVKGCRDPAMFKIELGVTDLSLGIVHRGLRTLLVGRALVDSLFRSKIAALELLRTRELTISKCKPGVRRLQLGIGLRQLDFVGARVDGEEKIAFADDVPVLEIYSSQSAADLGAELNLLDRGKLTQEAQSGINLAREWLAHHDLRKGRSSGRDSGITLPKRLRLQAANRPLIS
jgi:hypothetical protein